MDSDEVLIAVNVANADTEAGLFSGADLLDSWTMTTPSFATADELELSLRFFLGARDLPVPGRAILSSVVPSLSSAWVEALGRVTKERPLVVGPGLRTGLAMEYKDPGRVGADRVAYSLAARELVGAPVIAVDCGAVTSISVVSREGAFLGGAIAPGIGLSLDALSGGAAQISEVGQGLPAKVIARTTFDAVRVGTVLGEAARLDGLVRAMQHELGYDTRLVATGRFADIVCAASQLEMQQCADLTLQGLRLIFELNRR